MKYITYIFMLVLTGSYLVFSLWFIKPEGLLKTLSWGYMGFLSMLAYHFVIYDKLGSQEIKTSQDSGKEKKQ